MAVNPMLVPERARSIGKFTVGRLLPFRKKRQVGPFTFIDHMGPVVISKGSNLDVDQHPHIGLCTLTYLFEGGVEHTDSTGARQIIRAGDVGLMTAGKGITHAERVPQELKSLDQYSSHGYQIWIALPKELESMPPRFDFLEKEQIPQWEEADVQFKLIAGKAFGKTSPLPVHSELFMLDIRVSSAQSIDFANEVRGEIGIIIISGSVQCDTEQVDSGNMIIHEEASSCSIMVNSETHLLVFGGTPFPEERFLLWNFVSSSKETLKQAESDWRNKRFPKIPGDDSYIEMPLIKR